jgi:dihydroorotase
MNKPLLIKRGHLIDPSQKLDEVANLLLAEGKIAWMGKGEPPQSDYEVFDARGLIVCPGLIDMHVHLRDPGYEEKETIASGAKAAAKGGFTTICCMPNTDPPLDKRTAIDYVKAKAAAEAVVRVLPIGCITKGRKGKELAEMGELAAAGVVAFSDDGEPALNSYIMRQALDYSRAFDLPVTDHCEDTILTEGGQMNEGTLSAKLGLRGIPNAAEDIIVARDLALAELTGGWLHVAHTTTAGAVELIRRAKAKGVRVTAEATPHHLTLTEERVKGYDTNAKVNPPLRTEKDIEALIKGLNDNTIDIIATDHAPHTEGDKLCEFAKAPFGISGLETALGALLGLVHSKKLSLATLIAKLTAEPAKILGGRHGQLGTLAVGAEADVTVFDPEREWAVNTKDFASKGKNTPLNGEKLKGRVTATVYGGKIVHRDESAK